MNDEHQCKSSIKTRNYAPYRYSHVEYIISNLREMIRDVVYSVGMSNTSKGIILNESLKNLDFLTKLIKDSKQSLEDIEFISYSDDMGDSGVYSDNDLQNEEKCCSKEG